MRIKSSTPDGWDRAGVGVSLTIIIMAFTVIGGWHAHVAAVVQIFRGFPAMQYNTALSFLALGTAGLGVFYRRRLLTLAGGICAGVMGAVVIAEYASGKSLGIDTLFFYPWERTLSLEPGRMSVTTAVSFFLIGAALVIHAVRPSPASGSP